MKTLVSLAFALSSFVTVSTAQAQDRQVAVYSGPMAIELPVSILRGTSSTTASTGEASAARKVRVVLQSPYGN